VLFGVEVLRNNWFYAVYALAIIPITLAFDIIKVTTKFRISQNLELLYLIFIFFAEILGINLRIYYLLPVYDKVMHLISGALTAILSLLVLHHFKIPLRKKSFVVFFALSLTLAMAAGWEIFEYTVDRFGGDMQRTRLHGINDTMLDIIAALVGGVMVVLFIRRSKKIVKQSGNS
jgi:uncharacterized membrane protein YjdF